MRRTLSVLPLLLFSLLPLSAMADTFIPFTASGTFTDGSVLSGTLTIDTTIGKITGSNLIVSGPSSFTFVNIVNQSNTQVPGDYNVGDRNAASTEDFNFDLPGSPLVAYNGGSICSGSAPCLNGSRGSNLYNLTTSTSGPGLVTGTLFVPTPEPSSLALLGTGILGALGIVRRRHSRSGSN